MTAVLVSYFPILSCLYIWPYILRVNEGKGSLITEMEYILLPSA